MRRNYSTIMVAIALIGLVASVWFQFHTSVKVEIISSRIDAVERENADVKAMQKQQNDYVEVVMSGISEIKGYRAAKLENSLQKILEKMPDEMPAKK